MKLHWFSVWSAIERAHLNTLFREFALSIAPRTENSLQILPYFFYNFLIFSYWTIIFDIFMFNTSLYWFLLNVLILEAACKNNVLVQSEFVNLFSLQLGCQFVCFSCPRPVKPLLMMKRRCFHCPSLVRFLVFWNPVTFTVFWYLPNK